MRSPAIVLLLFLAAVMPRDLASQEASAAPARMERGEAHRLLDRLVGTWRTHHVLRFNGEEFVDEDTETYEWVEPTRVWLRKQVRSLDHPIVGEMNGFEFWSYDDQAEEYVNYWFDNQSPETFPHRGGWTDDDTLEMNGMIVWRGRDLHLRNVLEFDGPDRFTWRHFQSWDTDDAFEERSVVEYTRAGSASESGGSGLSDGTDALREYREHLRSITDGVWIASNAEYQAEDGGIDSYGMAYALQPSGLSATGCLWIQRNGEPQGVAWQFIMAWDPGRQAGLVYQSNAAGMVAIGYMEDLGPGRPELVQQLWSPDGSVTRIGHTERMDGPDRRVSRSLEWVDGGWSPRRAYTWVRTAGAANACQT